MHLHVVRSGRGEKAYFYGRLVQSYRREPDGAPMHRVLANLGRMTELEVANFRAALEASRKNQRVALVAPVALDAAALRPDANLRYLDVAVLLELWREWGLDGLLSDAMPAGMADLSPAQVVAALVIQRCADPGSKLYATRWFPRTALPELLGIAPDAFNNTRLHRVLDALDDAGPDLMRKLPRLYEKRDGAFVSLFLDVTDTWFVGDGPEAAQSAKTKEGLIRRKVGIVLLCNEHGYPLRWEVVAGKEPDCRVMESMLRSIAPMSWVGGAPVVVDRAMGKSAQLATMLSTNLRFLTALTVTEFDSYAPQLPHAALSKLDLDAEDDEVLARCAAEAGRLAQASGMAKAADDLFVLECGVVQRTNTACSRLPASAGPTSAEAVRLCGEMLELVAGGSVASLTAAGRALGLGKPLAGKYAELRRLSEEIRREVIAGDVAYTLTALSRIARIAEPEAQRRAFDELAKQAPNRRAVAPRPTRPDAGDELEAIRVRTVAYFNPQRFVEQRLQARRRLARVAAYVDGLNARLASPRARMGRDAIIASVDRCLRREELLDAYTVKIDHGSAGRPAYQVRLTLDSDEWARRRRYDGFTVLAAHPELPHDATQLCKLYRAKDAVEKDFQVIKGIVQLRPVRHRLDRKVRAHVTLCMLALLLERTLARKLAPKYTAAAALEYLASCHLNRYRPEGAPQIHALTRPDAEQDAILRALHLRHLADHEELLARLTPR